LIVAAVVIAVLAIAVLGVSWFFSSALITPNHEIDYDETVVAVTDRSVTLERSDTTDEPGIFGLYWKAGNGHAIAGSITSQANDRLVRKLSDVSGSLRAGTKVFVGADVYQGTPRQALGIPFKSVTVRTQLGPAPAWFVPGRSRTWAIYVHGLDADRMSGLRLMPALRRLGMPILDITYRNDAGAPRAPDGKIHLGATEWHDLDSAVAYAKAHGARKVVPIGMSMGGEIVAEFMRHSRQTALVPRIVLDAPALDWGPILDLAAHERGLPTALVGPVELVTEKRIDVNFSSLDQIEHARAFEVPILLFHGGDDNVVPLSVSERFARALPRLVQLHVVPDAGHVKSWNVDRRAYERYLTRFLRSVAGSN
jgi:fermentation-respiration switch protein FrsA (DUF1100 family)